MQAYIAFLRAINVGGRVCKMEALRRVFAAVPGVTGVETFIASGNVLFSSRASAAALEGKLEKALHTALGYEVDTFLRTGPELARLVDETVVSAEWKGLYVGFIRDTASAAVRERVQALSTADEQ